MAENVNLASVEIAKKFKKHRIHKGLTQGQLAIKTGIVRSSIADYENNRCKPSLKRYFILCQALDMNVI